MNIVPLSSQLHSIPSRHSEVVWLYYTWSYFGVVLATPVKYEFKLFLVTSSFSPTSFSTEILTSEPFISFLLFKYLVLWIFVLRIHSLHIYLNIQAIKSWSSLYHGDIDWSLTICTLEIVEMLFIFIVLSNQKILKLYIILVFELFLFLLIIGLRNG